MFWLPYSSYTSYPPSQTPSLPWISYATQKLMLNSCKMVENSLKHSIRFCSKQNLIAYRSSKVSSRPDCIFEIHQQWQSDFSRVYSNCCCSCWFEAEIIKIGQSSHKMYSNNILNFQESTTILMPIQKSRETYRIHIIYFWRGTSYKRLQSLREYRQIKIKLK